MISITQLAKEMTGINARRGANGLPLLEMPSEGGSASAANGLALSGGGIRSAAMCLGAVQALQVSGKLKHLDYLSTVSGGGYIGCCLAANMSEERGFPFLNEANDLNDLQDSAAVKYIRDHTNYLMPAGFSDFLASLGVILRGLATSAVLVMGPLLVLAGLTACVLKNAPAAATVGFKLTFAVVVIFAAYLVALAIRRSLLEKRGGISLRIP